MYINTTTTRYQGKYHGYFSVRAAGEYAVDLDEGMGPEVTGWGPMGVGRCWTKNVLIMVEV